MTKGQMIFLWYQQLVAESLGKKGKGILPVISNMLKTTRLNATLFRWDKK